jgi:hypothetical protein
VCCPSPNATVFAIAREADNIFARGTTGKCIGAGWTRHASRGPCGYASSGRGRGRADGSCRRRGDRCFSGRANGSYRRRGDRCYRRRANRSCCRGTRRKFSWVLDRCLSRNAACQLAW